MKVRPGIKLLKEIEGHGRPLADRDRDEACYKFYRNRGDPMEYETCWHKPIPEIVTVDGKDVIGWMAPKTVRTRIVYEHEGWLVRQSDLLPGLYYSLLGMNTMGYRCVSIVPRFMSNSLATTGGDIEAGSIIKVEIFLIRSIQAPVA